ncbi:MAG: TonB family protein [Candidatus Sulfotelmatobacter sp.]
MSSLMVCQHSQRFENRIGRRVAFATLALALLVTGLVPTAPAQSAAKAHRKILVTVKPEYPQTLRSAQIGGLVRLSATVLPNGTVSKVEVRGGNPILAECASAAVLRWKYAPAATETSEEISLSFSPH